MTHYAYTWVHRGVTTYEEQIDTQGRTYLTGHKWPGGMVFASEAACTSGKAYFPRWEGSPSLEMRRVELPGSINTCAKRDPERAGAWILTVFAKILPADEKAKKKAKKKVRKKKDPSLFEQPTLFGED